jgi:hypothetical protein
VIAGEYPVSASIKVIFSRVSSTEAAGRQPGQALSSTTCRTQVTLTICHPSCGILDLFGVVSFGGFQRSSQHQSLRIAKLSGTF